MNKIKELLAKLKQKVLSLVEKVKGYFGSKPECCEPNPEVKLDPLPSYCYAVEVVVDKPKKKRAKRKPSNKPKKKK